MRSFFPQISSQTIYFDTAATALKPAVVLKKMDSFLSLSYGTVHRAVYPLCAQATALYNKTRENVAQFIDGQDPDEIIFTKGATESINLVASSFGKAFLEKGDEVLIVETEHHANIVPWQLVCQERGATLKVLRVDNSGAIREEELLSCLSSLRVKMVAVAHVASSTGVLHPLEKIIPIAHAHGAKVLVDAAQSIAYRKISVRELNPDFLVFSGHKMYGPTGTGVLYGRKELLDALPPYQGGGDMIDTVDFTGTTYQKSPLRFEAGTPNIAGVVGLQETLAFLESIGRKRITERIIELGAYAIEKLQNIEGVELLIDSPKPSSIISFTCKFCHALDIGTLLGARGISVRTGHLCAQPTLKRFGKNALIRISFGIYNTFEEIDQFIYELQKVMNFLRGGRA